MKKGLKSRGDFCVRGSATKQNQPIGHGTENNPIDWLYHCGRIIVLLLLPQPTATQQKLCMCSAVRRMEVDCPFNARHQFLSTTHTWVEWITMTSFVDITVFALKEKNVTDIYGGSSSMWQLPTCTSLTYGYQVGQAVSCFPRTRHYW